MADKTDEFPAGEKVPQEHWYNSVVGVGLAKGLMYGLLAVGGGIGFSYIAGVDDKERVQIRTAEIEAQTRVEYQRLRTLEEITRSFGTKMTPQEFLELTRQFNLQPKK